VFNFELDDLMARHPSHAGPVQSFSNLIMTFFSCYRTLDAIARFTIHPFVSALESSANSFVYNDP
jgi:hypothetical protein